MAMKKTELTKQQKMFHISLCIFGLEAAKGHLKWKVTELVRKSGISRPLIYRYFGSSKQEILVSAVEVFCSEFYGFAEDHANGGDLADKINEARERMSQHHEAILFYQKWRAKDSFMKEVFVRIENKFQKKLKKVLPTFDDGQILMAHACIHGVVTAPFLTAAQAEKVCRDLMKKGILGMP